jgi:hypothetical protein
MNLWIKATHQQLEHIQQQNHLLVLKHQANKQYKHLKHYHSNLPNNQMIILCSAMKILQEKQLALL